MPNKAAKPFATLDTFAVIEHVRKLTVAALKPKTGKSKPMVQAIADVATFQAAVTPETVKTLLDALAAANKQVLELEVLCDSTYVAQGADVYHHACEEMERYQAKRAKARKEIGTQGSLCDGLSWVYHALDAAEAADSVRRHLKRKSPCQAIPLAFCYPRPSCFPHLLLVQGRAAPGVRLSSGELTEQRTQPAQCVRSRSLNSRETIKESPMEPVPMPAPTCYLSDGGNVYFLHEGRLFDAPRMQDGTIGMQDAGAVGFGDGISAENVAYCKSVEATLHLLVKRNLSEGTTGGSRVPLDSRKL